MPKHAATSAPTRKPTSKHSARTLAAAAFGVGALALTGAGVYAGLIAEAKNTTAEAVTSGTLKLELDSAGIASLETAVSNLAPGDVNNKYVVLTNSGTLVGKALGLKVADANNTPLTNDASKGLSVSVTRCDGAWVANSCTSAANALLPGTETSILAKTAVASLTSRTAFSGAIAPTAGQAFNLKVSLHMDGTETVTNGSLANDTVQGRTAQLTYTFMEDQRDGVTTNS